MKRLIPIIILFLLVSCGSQSKAPDYSWTLPAVDFERLDFPVSIRLPDGLDLTGKKAVLSEIIDNKSYNVACQLKIGDELEQELSWVVQGMTKAGEERVYQINFGKGDTRDPVLTAEKNDSTLIISKEGKQILHYRHSELAEPEGASKLFARSGFIHPLYSPSGECLTWVQPPDHIHHVGLWNPWTKVTWKENHTDFWNLIAGLGTVKFKDVISLDSGPVFAEFKVLQDHVAFVPPKPKNDEKYEGQEVIVIEEEWIIRVWNVSDGYLLDFYSNIRNVLDESISLDAYRYGGGLGYRATGKWNKDNSSVLTSEGKVRKDGDATRAKWCMLSGDLEGINTALLFMSDTENYDFPQPMRIWPENSNGVGHQYFEFTPIREKAWILEPGNTYTQYYRIWVKEGELNAQSAEQQWQQYVEALNNKNSYLAKN